MRLVLGSILAAASLMIAGCGGDEEAEEAVYCCALYTLCNQGSAIHNPCLADKAVLDAANLGEEKECKKMFHNSTLDVHLYDCSLRDDCYYTEDDALAACRE